MSMEPITPVWVEPRDPKQMAFARALILLVAGTEGTSFNYWEGYDTVTERFVNGKWEVERRPQIA